VFCRGRDLRELICRREKSAQEEEEAQSTLH